MDDDLLVSKKRSVVSQAWTRLSQVSTNTRKKINW